MLNDRYVFSQLIDFLPKTRVRPLRRSLSWQSTDSQLLLFRSISLHGLRSTDLSREPARHRNLPPRPSKETLPRGLSRRHRSEHSRRCQRTPRLADLRGLRSGLDRSGAATVPGRWLRRSTQAYRLRVGFHDHRSLLDAVPLGSIPTPQGRDQTSHAHRPARKYPLFRADYPRQDSRCHHPRHLADRARCLLCDGPSLSRLRSTPSLEVGLGILRDSGQEQPRLPPTLVPPRGQDHGIAQRPNDRPLRAEDIEALPRSLASRGLPRPQDGPGGWCS